MGMKTESQQEGASPRSRYHKIKLDAEKRVETPYLGFPARPQCSRSFLSSQHPSFGPNTGVLFEKKLASKESTETKSGAGLHAPLLYKAVNDLVVKPASNTKSTEVMKGDVRYGIPQPIIPIFCLFCVNKSSC